MGFWKGNLRKIGVLVKGFWKNNGFLANFWKNENFGKIEILGFRVKDLKMKNP